MNFPFVDFTIAVIFIIATIVGIKRGFLKSLIRLISFAIAVFFAYLITGGIVKISGNWLGAEMGALAIVTGVFRLVIIITLFIVFEVVIGFAERRIVREKNNTGAVAASKLLGFTVGIVKAFGIVIVCLTLIVFLFPGENPVTAEIRVSVVGKFLFETNPLPGFVEMYLF